MPSTAFSFLSTLANISARLSCGKNLPEYGSNRSFTILSASFLLLASRSIKSGSSGSGLVATLVQYDITSLRVFQLGNNTPSINLVLVSRGIGCRERLLGKLERGFRIDVLEGSKGVVVLGVRRAFRFVDILSSMEARERRRKSRSRRVLKQN
jgi:hypothetical protein